MEIGLFHPAISTSSLMRYVFFVCMIMATVACSQKKGENSNSDIFLAGKELGEVTNKKLAEASGLAASADNPGLLWTLNDSGNKPEVYLIDEQLNIRLTCRLKNVINRDWEDLTVGPGPEP